MHEIGIADSILQAVRDEAVRHVGAQPYRVCVRIGELSAVDPDSLRFCFCASGGTFNNKLLKQRLLELLQDDGFDVFFQSQVPCGDGGLSLGQAMIAAYRRSS